MTFAVMWRSTWPSGTRGSAADRTAHLRAGHDLQRERPLPTRVASNSHDARHLDVVAEELDRASDNTRLASKLPLPAVMAEDDRHRWKRPGAAAVMRTASPTDAHQRDGTRNSSLGGGITGVSSGRDNCGTHP
jgi:hypothetical protein